MIQCVCDSACIVEVLREHRKKCQQDKDLLPYVAIIHVRDMLIVPSERCVDCMWCLHFSCLKASQAQAVGESSSVGGCSRE